MNLKIKHSFTIIGDEELKKVKAGSPPDCGGGNTPFKGGVGCGEPIQPPDCPI